MRGDSLHEADRIELERPHGRPSDPARGKAGHPAPRLSVAIPLYNEETSVPELLQRVGRTLEGLPGGGHEIVLVDDGSTDGTLSLIEQAAADDDRIVVVALSRNFGHQAALSAGLDHATGDVVVVMDGDLQDAPEDIPRLLEHYRLGFDVVYATRRGRKETWWLRACYFLYYRLASLLSSTQLPLDAGDFGLMSRRVVNEIRRLDEHNRYLRGLRSWVGFRQTGVPMARSARHSGHSKYGLGKLVALALDGIFSFSVLPIRLVTMVGAAAALATVFYAAYSVWAKLFLDRSPQGFTALVVIITFVSGLQLFFLGIIGEYVGRVYEEAKGRPIYVTERIVRRGQTVIAGGKASSAEGETVDPAAVTAPPS